MTSIEIKTAPDGVADDGGPPFDLTATRTTHPALLAEISMTEFNPSLDTPPPPAPGPARLSFSRRAAASALLIVGLFAVGGTAVVMAADPSASPSPSTSAQPSTGGSGAGPSTGTNPGGTNDPSGRPNHANGQDCPDKGAGTGGTGSSGGSNGTQTAPSTPATPGSSAAPAV